MHAPQGKKTIRIMNRKDFFKTAGRIFILGGISASTGYLVLNNKVTASCSVSPTCKSCSKFSKCENPAVKKARYGKEK
jgi:hypothetical protein